MLGFKSYRGPITGEFAEKLREQIALAVEKRQAEKAQVQTKNSEKSK